MPGVGLAAVFHRQHHHEFVLDLRHRLIGVQPHEAGDLGEVGGAHAAALLPPAPHGLPQTACTGGRDPDQVRVARDVVAQDHVQVVLQVLPDGRQMRHAGDAQPLQGRAIAHARQLQQFGRKQAAAADDDLLARTDLAQLTALHHLHADRARAFEQDPGHRAVALQLQVGALAQVRQDVGLAGVVAFAPLHHHLGGTEAVLGGTVQVRVVGPAGFLAGLAQGRVPGIVGAQFLHPDRPALAMPGIVGRGEGLVVLALLEVGQDLVPAPAGIAGLRPAVVIQPVAAHVHEHVERGATAQAATGRMVGAATVQARIGGRVEAPVVGAAPEPVHQ